jgi:hypothetical protein
LNVVTSPRQKETGDSKRASVRPEELGEEAKQCHLKALPKLVGKSQSCDPLELFLSVMSRMICLFLNWQSGTRDKLLASVARIRTGEAQALLLLSAIEGMSSDGTSKPVFSIWKRSFASQSVISSGELPSLA